MIRSNVWRNIRIILVAVVLVFLVGRFESDFVNPNDGTKVPVGIWKVEDLKAIADEASLNSGTAQLIYSENAKVAQVDVLHDNVFQLTFLDTESFSTFTNVNNDEKYILSHDGDLFARWDDIYVDGAIGVLVGIDRDSQEKVFYPITVFSPDFDSDSKQIVYSTRNRIDTEVSIELLKLIPSGFSKKQLQLFTSVDLVDAMLIIEPVSLPES